nr:tautomerase family protein [Millisia brevis]
MPMIHLTAPIGVLTDQSRTQVRASLSATLLRWEGAPDTAFFRSLAWVRIDEVPAESFGSVEDDLPRFRVDVTVPEGALSERRKAGLVGDVTAEVSAAAGLDASDVLRVWVLIHEQPEGTWGAGGAVIRFADLRAAAAGARAGS